ncbi:MAG TPA: isoprenylcysteine carboxylmethyltransferase family protein [Methanoregulaceae archaeon]|nr:isoprenylcysteine carboxylmethyltransferase family protein [Methanoregulaceae archaeon]
MDLRVARLKKAIYSRILAGFVIMGLLLFLPAGSLFFWQGWVYIGILFIPMIFVLFYFLKNDPGLLERRMKMREKEHEQKLIIALSMAFFLIGFLIPGFDFRFGWSDVPVALVLAADGIVLLGYGIFFLTLRANSYASRVIEVELGQEIITTGPYAIVRHPMYSGILLIFLFTPLALGSYWALIAFIPMLPLLMLRIRNEEEVLVRELPGYEEYRQKTRYRLIPFMW